MEVHQLRINQTNKIVKEEKQDVSNFEKKMDRWHKNGRFEYVGTVHEGEFVLKPSG